MGASPSAKRLAAKAGGGLELIEPAKLIDETRISECRTGDNILIETLNEEPGRE